MSKIRVISTAILWLGLAAAPTLAVISDAHLTSLQAQVAGLRGLAFKHPVPFEVLTRDQIIHNLTAEVDHDTQFPEYNAFLKAFGFVPDDFDTRKVLLGLYGEQVGGYYDPKTARFYLNKDAGAVTQPGGAAALGINMEDMTIAHELTHALQDQYFNLQKIEDSVDRGTEDQKLAVSALFEGDATAVMIEQPFKQMGVDPALLAGVDISSLLQQSTFGGAGQFPQFDKAPLYFQKSMMFPYIYGLHFVTVTRQHGGWPAVNERYTRLPASTQEILNAGQPVPTSLPLRFTPLPEANWKHVTGGTLGAYLYGVLVEQYHPSHPPADQVHHWLADTYEVDEDGGHHRLLRWVSRWDDETAAATVFDALSHALPQRHAGLAWQHAGALRLQWQDASGHTTVLQRSAAQVEWIDEVPSALIEPALHLESAR